MVVRASTMPFRLSGLSQCEAVTRSGARCSITSASSLRDASQRLVSEPLRCGGRTCLLHMSNFCTFAAPALDNDVAVFYLDFETSGLDVLSDEVVEVGVTEEETSAQFATTILPTHVPNSPAVHGIGPEELHTSVRFNVAFDFLVKFLRGISEEALVDATSSDEEGESALPSVRFPPRTVLLAAHNGFRFDFAILVSECLKHDCNLWILVDFKFVDTLDVVRACAAAGLSVADGCARLQCLARTCCCTAAGRAHRALDDTVVLRSVIRQLAEMLGSTPAALLGPFARELDLEATLLNRMLVS